MKKIFIILPILVYIIGAASSSAKAALTASDILQNRHAQIETAISK